MKSFKPEDRIQTTEGFGGVHHGKIIKDADIEDMDIWVVEWDDGHRRTRVREHYLRHETLNP